MSDIDLDDLRAELDEYKKPEKKSDYSAKEQRIVAGFEEIERFVEAHGRAPEHGESRDIFERLYAVRLEQIRGSKECRELLQPLDSQGLLDANNAAPLVETISDETLLAELGSIDANDITQLRYVRSQKEKKAAEEIAQRTPCLDFDEFKSTFATVQHELKTGQRQTIKYQDNAEVNLGDLFILDGQKVMVAEMGELFTGDHGRPDCRLRVVYDNATESDLLLRSLQRALNKDKASRRITTPDLGPLFETAATDNFPSGCIYVLQSKSDHPFIATNRSAIHKIGVTSANVKKRIANAKKDPTYLLADVAVVRTFKPTNIKAKGLESLLHQFFGNARLDVELKDRFGESVKPREWFLVPIGAIEEAIERIEEETIDQFQYDLETLSLIQKSIQAKYNTKH